MDLTERTAPDQPAPMGSGMRQALAEAAKEAPRRGLASARSAGPIGVEPSWLALPGGPGPEAVAEEEHG